MNDRVILNYIHEPTQDYFLRIVKIDETKEKCIEYQTIINANDYQLENLFLIGANSFCSSTNGLHVFNWDLKLMKTHDKFNDQADQFNFGDNITIKQIEAKHDKYYWLNNKSLNITNISDGVLLKSIQIKGDKFVIDSNDNLILFLKSKQELVIFTIDGKIQNKCKLLNFPSIISTIYIDKHDRLSFLDKIRLELNILTNNLNEH